MTVAGLSPVQQDIVNSAEAYGVDPRLALAVADIESGFNPQAVGDQGTSFGLFQLHQGGELGSLSAAQAFNPVTNANTALAVVAETARANPGVTDPGRLAALSQRPADQAAYAAAVDSVYNSANFVPQIPGGAHPATLTSSTGLGPVGIVLGPGVAVGAGLLNDITGGAVNSAVDKAVQSSFVILLNIAFTVAALGLVLLGLTRLFPGVSRTIATTAAAIPKVVPV